MVPHAADAPAPTPSPWLAIVLAAIAVLGTVGTAYGPVMVERVKQRGARIKPSATAPEPPAAEPANGGPHARADRALDLVEEAMRDLRQQRDEAVRRVDELTRRNSELEAHIASANGAIDIRRRQT